MSISNVSGTLVTCPYAGKEQEVFVQESGFAKKMSRIEEAGSTQELTEAEKLEAFKKEIWNVINSYSWNKSMNVSIQITDGAFKRMMNDADFKDRMLGVIEKESIAAQPPGNVSLTWIDESGYKGYSYIDNDAGAIAFKAHSSDKDSFYVQKAKRNFDSRDLTEYYAKERRERELQQEVRDEEYFQRKELTEYWNRRQSAIASYEENILIADSGQRRISE